MKYLGTRVPSVQGMIQPACFVGSDPFDLCDGCWDLYSYIAVDEHTKPCARFFYREGTIPDPDKVWIMVERKHLVKIEKPIIKIPLPAQ